MDKGHILVLGGARSGKSQYAEDLALKLGRQRAYIATANAQNSDEEMAKRIELHILRRKDDFTNIEEPLELAEAIKRAAKTHDVILVDCLTLWVSNLMIENHNVENETKNLCEAVEKIKNATVIFVSSEVGLGIVPQNKLAREFRDVLGLLNQKMAKNCAEVYFIAAGLPLLLKGSLPK
ncbi:MAG: bifunctional adenosylcobinamide kinase/adenosylcobinamide-phosphate guanylyltransferase [Devosiaceae bacterium]|nr:bifunctional adenosylcobinamide kinase/adenosylcobinamide-phosphate guanylyltransferase [Devosiaceae bacterium]